MKYLNSRKPRLMSNWILATAVCSAFLLPPLTLQAAPCFDGLFSMTAEEGGINGQMLQGLYNQRHGISSTSDFEKAFMLAVGAAKADQWKKSADCRSRSDALSIALCQMSHVSHKSFGLGL
jgi:hypothetical protein